MINRKKTFRVFGIAALLFIVLAVAGKRLGWFGKSSALEVTTDKVEKRTIVEIITANGKVQPETEVKISSDVSGEIVELYFKEGEEVKKGDLLLKIKPDIYVSNLERMEASLNSAKANFANSKARLSQMEAQYVQSELSYNRNKTLFDKGAISQAEYDNALSAYQVAKAEVEASKQTVIGAEYTIKSSEASLREAKENLNKTSIFAPTSGTISKLNVELGERVVGTMQMAGTELLRVANLNMMEVRVDVNENDIVRVNLGDTALIEIDAYPDKKFRGLVTEIANSSSGGSSLTSVSTDQVTSFEVRIRVLPESYADLIPADNPKFYPFRPGMSATVDIRTEVESNVLCVPIQAVTTRIDSSNVKTQNNKDGKPEKEEPLVTDFDEFVFVYENGMAIQKKVKTGIQDDSYIQILEGLDEGQEVISGPYTVVSKRLKDKEKVMKVDRKALFSPMD
jgi:HlyD family secretion protein